MRSRVALLLLSWLIALSSVAQPSLPPNTAVDTRAECLALDGTWQTAADGWRAACEVPWSSEDCLRLGGSWTQVARAATGGRCLAPVSEWATALQCLDHGGQWTRAGSRAPACAFAPAPIPGRAPPVMAGDTGKRCENQKDCLYGCVYEGPEVAPGVAVPGRCRAAKVAAKCFALVDGGRLAGNICRK